MRADIPFAALGIGRYRERTLNVAHKHHARGIGIGKEKIIAIEIAEIAVRIESAHIITIDHECSMKECVYRSQRIDCSPDICQKIPSGMDAPPCAFEVGIPWNSEGTFLSAIKFCQLAAIIRKLNIRLQIIFLTNDIDIIVLQQFELI